MLIVTSVFGQSVQIDTFRLNDHWQRNDNRFVKMQFPIIRSGDKKIDSLINNDLKNRFTGNQYSKDNLDSALTKWIADQIVYLNFEVTYNQNGILSFNVSAEGCTAYCTSWTDYFNYSTVNGRFLIISDIIDDLGKFHEKVMLDINLQYDNQKKELKELANDPNMEIDEPTYKWANNEYSKCQQNFKIESFAICSDYLEIIENCYLPNAIKNLTPIIELKYHFTDIKDNLKIKN